MYVIHEPARETKVCCQVDLCVVGGSCTGMFAAVRAARLGLQVAVVEADNCLGGVATSSLVNVWHKLTDEDRKEQIIAGLTQETLERLKKVGAVTSYLDKDRLAAYELNTEELKIELDRLAQENSIHLFFHTMYCAPVLEEDRMKGIIIENKDGRQAILADFFIDASGDGDIARDTGLCPYQYDHIQPPSPCYRLLGDETGISISTLIQEHGAEFGLCEDWGWGGPIPRMPGIKFHADTHIFHRQCHRAKDLSEAEVEGRAQVRAILDLLRKYAPDRAFSLVSLYSHLGIRDSVHYETDYQITGKELMYGASFPDTVACGTYPIDIHHSDNAGITYRYLTGYEHIHNDRTSPPIVRQWREDGAYARYYQIPFRVLVQRNISNLIPAGRMIHADANAFGAVRVMVYLNQLGEAAGVAAYLRLHHHCPIWEIEGNQVRRLLIQGGSAIPN